MKQAKKYVPQYTQSRKWSEIEDWYLELIESGLELGPMLDLVRSIRASQLKDSLYAYTSMYLLIIGIYEKIERNSEALHIEFEFDSRQWYFKYYPKPFAPVEFEGCYPEELGVSKFHNIVRYLNW